MCRENEYFDLMRTSFRMMPDSVFLKNTCLEYVACSDLFAKQMGYESAEMLLGKTDSQLLQDSVLAETYENQDRLIFKTGENIMDSRQKVSVKDAYALYRSTSKYLVADSSGNPLGIFGKVVDITQDVIAEYRYHQEIRDVFSMSDADCFAAVFDLNQWEVVSQKVNPCYAEQIPLENADLDTILESLRSCSSEEEDTFHFYRTFSLDFFLKQYRQGRDYFSHEYFHRLLNGRNLWMKDTLLLRMNPQNDHLMVLMDIRSIEESKQKELALHRAAEMDGLTGLLNRNHARKRIGHFLSDGDFQERYSVFMVDIDNFKQYNDTYGHQAGDNVLMAVADVLKESFRKDDVVCRLGGDEFFAFVRHTEDGFRNDSRAQYLLDRVRACRVTGIDSQITVSIGVCSYPEDGQTVDALYASVDKALYEAKRRGKNQFYILGQSDTV